MTDEQLEQASQIQSQIKDLSKVIEYTEREDQYPLYINKEGYNLSARISPETDDTIRLLILADMKRNLEKIREQYKNL